MTKFIIVNKAISLTLQRCLSRLLLWLIAGVIIIIKITTVIIIIKKPFNCYY